MASIEALKGKYAAKGVEFVVVYVEDPHPGEPGFRRYTQPETYEQRKGYAQGLVAERRMETTVLVDEMDDAVWTQYGSLPNMVYIVDRGGAIAYQATWTMADKVDRVLSELVV